MSVLFQDTFNRADGAPGGDWTDISGTWDISSNQLRCHITGSTVQLAMPAGAVNDGSVTFLTGSSYNYTSPGDLLFYVRCDATNANSYKILIRHGAAGTALCQIIRRVSSAETVLAEFRQFTFSSGTHSIKISFIGGSIAVSFDSLNVGAVYDTGVASGAYLRIQGGSVDKVFCDTFTVEDVSIGAMYAIPSVVAPGSVGNEIQLIGVGTLWEAGTPGNPEFTSSSAGITSQTVVTSTTALIYYDAPLTAQIVTLTDPMYGRTCGLTIAASGAYTGPWTGLAGDVAKFISAMFQSIIDLMTGNLKRGEAESASDYYTRITALALSDPEAAILDLLLDALDPDLDGMQDGSPLLLGIRSSSIDISTQIGVMTQLGDYTLKSILDAIAAIEVTADNTEVLAAIDGVADQVVAAQTSLNIISTNDTVAISDARNDISLLAVDVGVVDENLNSVKADIEAIRTGSDYTLGTVGNWLLGLGSVQAVTLVAVLASLVGRGTATAIQIVDVVEDVVAEGTDLAGIATTILGWLGDQSQPTLPTLSVDLSGIVNDIAGVHDDLATDLGLITDAIDGAVLDLGSQHTALDAKLDQILEALGTPTGGSATWPGLAGVTLGTPVPITADMTLSGPIDGALYEITGAPSTLGKTVVGGHTSWLRLGQAAFVSDNGDMDLFQSVNWDNGILVPRIMLTPASLVLHFVGGVSGTVTPWVRA